MTEEEKINGENNYSASNIQVLEGLEAVRKRPAMYIGDISEKGLHHLVYEVVDNSIDEALAGYCDHIEVTINEDNSITVQDNGRGIPVDYHEKEKKSALEVVMTVLHAGGKFDKGSYKVSGGLHGVGVSCVNALSKHMTTQVFRNGKIFQQEYSCGHPLYSVKEVGMAEISGTKQTFWPDESIFTVTEYKFDILQARMRELAYLNKGITISLTDRRIKEEDGSFKKEIFHSDEGVKEFVRFLNRNNEALINDVIYLNTEKNNTPIECAIMYNTGYRESLHSYVNNINTIEGGTHEAGFRSALTRVLKKYAEDTKALEKAKVEISGEDFREGLSCVLTTMVKNPQFEGQTKGRLGNSEVRPAVEGIITQQLTDWLENLKNQEIAQQIVQKAIRAAQVREAARKTRDNARKANQLDAAPLVGKLSACRGKKAEDNELFIVEGDSAGGSAKQGRDSRYQAILPLRGKPLNAEKKRLDQVLSNEEFRSLITALGTSIDENFNLANLKYNKVIILSDADQDGAHIRAILLTFFFRYMKELVTGGHVYIGMPPLYKVQKGSKVLYAYDDKELAKCIKEAGKGYTLQRYKGLGEMNPEQLWATTMDPSQRKLMQVTIEDAALADRRITILMGDKVEPRRDYIIENADFNKPDNFELPEGQRGEGK